MFVQDIKFVDLKRSEWDKEKSDPKKGKYVNFTKKVYINYRDKTTLPLWFLSWCRYDPHNDFRDLIRDKFSKGYVEVVASEDDWVYPEPLTPDENGWYRFPGGDLILMKRPLIEELKDRLAAKAQSDKAAAATLRSFEADVRRQGGVPLTQEEMAGLLSDEKTFRQ